MDNHHTIQPSSHRRIETEIQRSEDHLTILEIRLLGRSIRLDLKGLTGDYLTRRASLEMYRLVLRRHCDRNMIESIEIRLSRKGLEEYKGLSEDAKRGDSFRFRVGPRPLRLASAYSCK